MRNSDHSKKYYTTISNNNNNRTVENRGKGEYEVLVERISENCGDETDLFLSVRNLNRHPLPLLPPPCC
jgi:hypothetical protein